MVVSAILDMLIQNDLFDNLPTTDLYSINSREPLISHKIRLISDDYEMWRINHDPHDNKHSVARAIMYAIDNDMLSDVRVQLLNYAGSNAHIENKIISCGSDILGRCTHMLMTVRTLQKWLTNDSNLIMYYSMDDIKNIVDATDVIVAIVNHIVEGIIHERPECIN